MFNLKLLKLWQVLDNETAWNIICRFKDIVENKNDKDNEMF